MVGIMMVAAIVLSAEPAFAWLCNGWETEFLLANRARGGYKIKTYLEYPFAEVGSDGSGIIYESGTFSGTGDNDARYYVMRVLEDEADLLIAELGPVDPADLDDPDLVIRPEINTTTLRTLYPSLPYVEEVATRNIRYNPVTNSIFFLTKEKAQVGFTTLWEVDLELSTLLSVTTGPLSVTFDKYELPGVAINHDDGTVYGGGPYINTPLDGKGDVVEFDLSAGTWSVILDSTVTGDEYKDVEGLCYRDNSIIVGFGSWDRSHPPIEYDLSTMVGTTLSGFPWKVPARNIQMDRATGSIWFAGQKQGREKGALFELKAGSNTAIANPLSGGRWIKFFDVASPPGLPLVVNLDILPSDDPNNFAVNLNSKGRLPIAILGSETLDVNEIDVNSISIAGTVLPLKTPSVCDESGDGIPDLVVHVSRRDLIMALGLDEMDSGTVVPITVEGNLQGYTINGYDMNDDQIMKDFYVNGRPFRGTDSIILHVRID